MLEFCPVLCLRHIWKGECRPGVESSERGTQAWSRSVLTLQHSFPVHPWEGSVSGSFVQDNLTPFQRTCSSLDQLVNASVLEMEPEDTICLCDHTYDDTM